MKKIVTNWRYWLMMIIGMAAFINLLAWPLNSNPNYWALVIYSKFTTFALTYMDIRLFVYFARHRKIDEVFNFVNEEDDNL